MPETPEVLLPRALAQSLERASRALPVTVVTGARQTGKRTLVRDLAPPRAQRLYVTPDDLDIRDQAANAPDALLRRAERMTLDEVQRAPDLLLAIKRAVDERREPGRFLLTGSANLLRMQQVPESLAGRAAYLTLWPLTRREQLGMGNAGIWGNLLAADPVHWLDLASDGPATPESWHVLLYDGTDTYWIADRVLAMPWWRAI